MTPLTDIAANYKRAACLVTGDGREWWRVEADRQVWLFMVEAARLGQPRLGQPGRVGAPTGRGARGGDADYRGDNES